LSRVTGRFGRESWPGWSDGRISCCRHSDLFWTSARAGPERDRRRHDRIGRLQLDSVGVTKPQHTLDRSSATNPDLSSATDPRWPLLTNAQCRNIMVKIK